VRPRPFKASVSPEQREWRFAIPFPLEATLRSIDGLFQVVGTVVNLSQGGMRIRAPRHAIPTETELEITLPEVTSTHLKLAGWIANIEEHSIGIQLDQQCLDTMNITSTLVTECQVFGAEPEEIDEVTG